MVPQDRNARFPVGKIVLLLAGSQQGDPVKQAIENDTVSGPWALVTGASAGIGEEFCRQLSSQGYNLVMVARREERMQALASELEKAAGVASKIITANLAHRAAPEAIEDQIKAAGIEVEFLVNNAGYGLPKYFTGVDWSDHADFIQVMVTAVCDLTWRLLPGMQERGKGFIINVASVAGLVPSPPSHTLYGASKAFVIRFSESLAQEQQSTGVFVSALCPGFTYSEFHDVAGTRSMVSKMSPSMWMNADDVVAYGIRAVQPDHHQIIAVPGRVNRNIVRLMRYLPVKTAQKITGKSANKFRKQ